MWSAPVFPWGKLTRSGPQTLTHSLMGHMTNVAAVMHRLLCLPAVQRALQRVAGRSLTDTDRARLGAVAVLADSALRS